MEMKPLPIACALTAPELHERRSTVLAKVRRGVIEVKELPDGYAYAFPGTSEWLSELAGLVDLERQCCPFLQFRITVAANGGPLTLQMTGPEGTKEFLWSVFQE
jgi:hypothetical protein